MASQVIKDMMDEEPKIDMTPMIDCVFLLLIFFMCMKFKSYEKKLASELPKDEGLSISRPKPQQALRIRLVYQGENTVEIQPGAAGLGPFTIIPASGNTEEMFARLQQQLIEGFAMNIIGDKIELSPDPEVPFDYVALALDAIHKAQEGIPEDDRKRITFQAAPPEGR